MLNRRSSSLREAPVQYTVRTVLAVRVLVILMTLMTCMRCRNTFTVPLPPVSDPSLVFRWTWNARASVIMASIHDVGMTAKLVVCPWTTSIILLTLRRSDLIRLEPTIGILPVLGMKRHVILFRHFLCVILYGMELHFLDLRKVPSPGVW